jgi:hypothetical protein
LAVGLVTAMAALILSACSVPLPSSTACDQATEATLQAVQSKLNVNATLRNGRSVGPTSNGWTLVSAELHKNGDKTNSRGDILTWALPKGASTTGADFFAVDSKARSDSTWPRASFSVTAPGAIKSRGCVEAVRGTVPCPAEGSGLAIPLGVKVKRSCSTTTTQAP